MTTREIVQAWRDPMARSFLSNAERHRLPDHPAGMIELTGTALESVAGGWGSTGGSAKSKATGSAKTAEGTAACGCPPIIEIAPLISL